MRPFFQALLFTALAALGGHASSQEGLPAELAATHAKATAGDAESAFLLGQAYDAGRGAPQSETEAQRWYRFAAEKGHAEAQNSLAIALQTDEKFAEALLWYEKAAAQNHAPATNNLAYLHDAGLGTPQDRKKAFELYKRSAEMGWAEAMWNIANMYGAGQLGEPASLPVACVWTMRAERFAGSADVKLRAALQRIHPYLAIKLSAEEMRKCRETADGWEPGQVARRVDRR